MMRVVFDTNTLVSAHFWQGPPHRALNAVRAGKIQLLATEETIAEFDEVVHRSKFARHFEIAKITPDDLMSEYRLLVEVVTPAPITQQISDDPDDDIMLACAVGGQADYIISGDDDLLRLGSYQDIPIWNVRQLLNLLSEPD